MSEVRQFQIYLQKSRSLPETQTATQKIKSIFLKYLFTNRILPNSPQTHECNLEKKRLPKCLIHVSNWVIFEILLQQAHAQLPPLFSGVFQCCSAVELTAREWNLFLWGYILILIHSSLSLMPILGNLTQLVSLGIQRSMPDFTFAGHHRPSNENQESLC